MSPGRVGARLRDVKQLSGLDASFLYMETPTTYGHVNGLAIYERPSPDFDPYQAAYERFDALIGRLEPMRRRLVEVPFQLDHPYWIDDPDFDLNYHVRHIGLAPPGGADQLAEQVARIVGRRMDRSRPLWEAYVIEGLADGRWAMLTKTHHATIDGASGVLLLNLLTDPSPDTPMPEHTDWVGEEVPSDRVLLERTMRNLALNPIKGMRVSLRMVRNFAEAAGVDSVSAIAGQARDLLKSMAIGGAVDTPEPTHRVRIPLSPAPPTPFNKTITPHRRFAMRSTALGNIKAIKDASGCTVNDVVMAICTGALREYLIGHDALPEQPLRAMVPVSIRTGEEEDPWTNRVGGIIADLPTNCADPLERLRRCHEAMNEAKRQMDVLPAEDIADLAQVAPPLAATAAMRLQSRLRLADRVNLPDERGDLQRARAAKRALLRRSEDEQLHPGLDDRRRHGPEHHGAQLSRSSRFRADRRPGTGARPLGSRRPAHRRDRATHRGHGCRVVREAGSAVDAPRDAGSPRLRSISEDGGRQEGARQDVTSEADTTSEAGDEEDDAAKKTAAKKPAAKAAAAK